MIAIKISETHRIVLADTESWTLEKHVPRKDGGAEWRFVANMRSLENMLARCAMRNIQIEPENFTTLTQIAAAWAVERERLVQAVKAARVPDATTISSAIAEWECRNQKRAAARAANRRNVRRVQ